MCHDDIIANVSRWCRCHYVMASLSMNHDGVHGILYVCSYHLCLLRATPLAEKGLPHDVCWAVQVIGWPEGYQRWRGRLLLCHHSPGRLWEPGQHPDFHFLPTGPELASAGETVCRNRPLLQEQSSNSCFHHAINYCHWYNYVLSLRSHLCPSQECIRCWIQQIAVLQRDLIVQTTMGSITNSHWSLLKLLWRVNHLYLAEALRIIFVGSGLQRDCELLNDSEEFLIVLHKYRWSWSNPSVHCIMTANLSAIDSQVTVS